METKTEWNKVNPQPESGKPKKCCCKRGKIIAVILVFLIAGAICCHIHHPRPRDAMQEMMIDLKPGTVCTVQFRRDALGGSTSLISPTTTGVNGTTVSIKGTLVTVNHEAILLEQVDNHFIVNDMPQLKRLWIPKSSILLIEYSKSGTD